MKRITVFNTLVVAALIFAATACAVPALPAPVTTQPAGASVTAAPAASVVSPAVAAAVPASAPVPIAGTEPPSATVPTQTGSLPTLAPTPSTPSWPIQGWRTSTPEAQGLDPEELAGLFDALHAADARVFSVLVVGHGYLVVEQDMVVVTTADLGDLADSTIPPLLPTYVLSAVKAAGPLAANPAAQARLAKSIKQATR